MSVVYNRTRGGNTVNTSTGSAGSLYSKTWSSADDMSDYVESSPYPNLGDPDTFYEIMHDVNTPDFKRRIAQGQIINNPMDMTKVTEVRPKAASFTRESVNKLWNGSEYYYSGQSWFGTKAVPNELLGTPLYFDSEVFATIDSLRHKAVTEAHANASSAELSLLMVAAEGRKSVESMGSIMYRVFRIVKAARKLDLKYIRKELTWKELQDRYMELRYAIRPLVIDAKGTMSALEESKAYKSTRATARGFASYSFTDEDSFTTQPDSGHELTIARKSAIVVDIRAGVLTDVVKTPVSVWGLDQPLETMWEVIPFSFIIDWFINVGETIAAWSPSAGVTELASWVTVHQNRVHENSLVGARNLGSYNYKNSFSWSGTRTITSEHKTRYTNPQLSVYPMSNIRLDTLKLLDLSIITKALFSKRLR